VDKAGQDILSLMGECSPSKEVVIAVQEAIERVESSLNDDDVNDDEQNHLSSLPSQLITLVGLYASCECLIWSLKLAHADTAIPRLKLRRKKASETIRPLLSELEAAITLAGARSSRDEGRSLINGVSHLVRNVVGWMNTIVDITDEEILAGKVSSIFSLPQHNHLLLSQTNSRLSDPSWIALSLPAHIVSRRLLRKDVLKCTSLA
jgi:hypothetical protein